MPKTHHTEHRVEEVLENIKPEQIRTVQNLRQLIKDAVPEAEETVRHGKLTYRLQDRDFVWITVTMSHMDLEFAMGSSLSSMLLKSRGIAEQNKNIRHVEVGDFAAVQSELKRLVKAAAVLEIEHGTSA